MARRRASPDPAVLILAGGGDPQADRAAAALASRGVPVVHIDTARFPESVRLTQTVDGYFLDGAPLPPIRSVYVRGLGWHPLAPFHSGELAERPHGFIAQCEEKRALLESLLLDLEADGARIVNTIAANALHGVKPHQFRLIERAGAQVPPWIATNDPRTVRAFAAAQGAVIYKPLSGGARVQPLEPGDLTDERLAALGHAPVLFQRRVEGLSLRVFVIEGTMAGAAAIHSDELDYRGHEERVEAVALSKEEEADALRAAGACAMPFTGVDIIRAADRSWVLECNPSPMFAQLELRTGLDVAAPLADLLARLP